jgi:hypothetical protein
MFELHGVITTEIDVAIGRALRHPNQGLQAAQPQERRLIGW